MSLAKFTFYLGRALGALQNAPHPANGGCGIETAGTLLADAQDILERAAERAEAEGRERMAGELREAADLAFEAARLASNARREAG
jgi:hypothetical protein